MERPRVSSGVIVDSDDPTELQKLAQALDALEIPASKETAADDQGGTVPPRPSMAEAVEMATLTGLPPEGAGLIALPKLSNTEINEISAHLALFLESEFGYTTAPMTVNDALPIPPKGIIGGRTVARGTDAGTHVLRFGCRRFVSQPPQLWTLGVIVGPDGSLAVNPDREKIEPKVTEIVATVNEMRQGLQVRDLEAKLIQLSYVDATAALNMLQGMGVTTMNKPTELPSTVDFPKLPYVVSIEDPGKEYTGLIGADTKMGGGNFKISLSPGVASNMTDNAIASPTNQLLVLFHPAHPEHFSEVRQILDTLIDRPARQIFIEAMVLEISEEGLRDLGIEWNWMGGNDVLTLSGGSSNAGVSTDTLNLTIPEISNLSDLFEAKFDWDWEVVIRALIRTGKAEILSRPGVMTLNNRQSTIRVGTDIPIASSLQGNYGGKVSFSFEYLPIGILLNIRPRISESGAEVSMLIDTVVSARVPGEDLELKDPSDPGLVLASAPTVSTRRVQTYGRIANNTPLIIGGLVSREKIVTMDKIPFLGDLPLIGMAFRSEIRDNLKREVIIVLTPHVLSSKEELRRSLPKDDDLFDSFGNKLFRDSYRIRSEDVFDLSFLLENRRIATYRQKARQVAQQDFRLGEQEPFRSFVRDSVPGESILVTRMIYEVIKRLDIAEKIDPSRIIYFESHQAAGYTVKFLETLLNEEGGGQIRDFEDKALAITYRYDRESLEEGRLGTEPIPEIRLIECPNRDVWASKLWELNQPLPDGRHRHTILIQNEQDLLRLRRALALKRIVVLHGGADELRLRHFSVGKVLLMPQWKKHQIQVADSETAMFFFHTEHYYAAALAEIEKQLKALDLKLREPEISILLESDVAGNAPAGGK
jgi:general secretion pathway protein D